MNQTQSFELERICQATRDLADLVRINIIRPESIGYTDKVLDFTEVPVFQPFGSGDIWGGFDMRGWFHYEFTVPPEMEGKELWLDITQDKKSWYAQSPQFLLYCNRKPLQGIDLNHEECLLAKSVHAGECYMVDLDAWSGMAVRETTWSGMENRPGTLFMRFYNIVPEVRALYYDLKVPYEILKLIGQDSEAGIQMLPHLSRAVDMLNLCAPGSEAFYQSVEHVRKYLKESLYDKENSQKSVCAYSVGHTHIDVAWLWRYAHTQMKVQRSFSTALKLLEEYPEYIFMSSQPQLYEYLEKNLPDQFAKVEEYVRQGRWEPEGGMWVEADCNLPSGESLIRQFLMGKQYFQSKFGIESRVLWLPDVFGYSAALPQICKKCGIDYFMTTKISWNQQDKIPYDTFLWKGIDGTALLTHFSPAKQYDHVDYNPFGFARSPHITSYNCELEPDYVIGGWKRYSQKQLNHSYLIAYGYGDGGGGTTRQMIEEGQRMEQSLPGCPKVVFSTVKEFFQHLEKEVCGREDLPVWNGELYLEFHRGTYTSVGMVKRWNRRVENLLQKCEFMISAALQYDPDFQRDEAAWDGMLKQFLTNQFHDVLPGSALGSVYPDVEEIYQNIFSVLQKHMDEAVAILQPGLPDGRLAVINTLGFRRGGIVKFDFISDAEVLRLKHGDAEGYPAQRIGNNRYIARIPEAAASGATLFDICGRCETVEDAISWDGCHLENRYLLITFGEEGTILSIYDKEMKREILSGPGNVIEAYEDRPYQYDAWEISPYYRRKQYKLPAPEVTVTEKGPVRICIRQSRRWLNSRIDQEICLYADSRKIDFHTLIDWQDEHIMLKAAFPVDIHADTAVYEIQFGTTVRPTHSNTSWDAERFETCAQRFADLAEPDYGTALLNDCKYGYDIHDQVMRLTLLRSPSFPNAVDKGHHEFTYSFMPHKGDWREAEIQKEAYDLNNPLFAVIGKGSAGESMPWCKMPLLSCENDGIFVETVKPAEDSKGLIARIYEGFGCRRHAVFHTACCTEVSECDMMEKNIECLTVKEGCFALDFHPYEIKTVRMQK